MTPTEMMAMNRGEISALFEQEQLTIAFDTNAIFGNRRDDPFLQLCDTLNRINEKRAPRQRIDKVISTPVYVEKLHDLRQQFADTFDEDMIKQFLDAKGIELKVFDTRDAEHTAQLIGNEYPTSAAWRAFKRERCLRCLGLSTNTHQTAGDGKRCSATIDWLVAGQADVGAYLLVTDDRGEEFRSIPLKARLDDVTAVATALLARVVTTG